MSRVLRVWKLKTLINTSHLLGFGNGRLWEAKCVVFYVSGRLREAQSVVFYVSGSSKRRKIHNFYSVLRGPGRLSPTQIRAKCRVPGAFLST